MVLVKMRGHRHGFQLVALEATDGEFFFIVADRIRLFERHPQAPAEKVARRLAQEAGQVMLFQAEVRFQLVRAAEHGRSMEEEARDILRQVVGQPSAPKNLGQSIHQRFAALGGVDLPLPARTPMRASPDFE